MRCKQDGINLSIDNRQVGEREKIVMGPFMIQLAKNVMPAIYKIKREEVPFCLSKLANIPKM